MNKTNKEEMLTEIMNAEITERTEITDLPEEITEEKEEEREEEEEIENDVSIPR